MTKEKNTARMRKWRAANPERARAASLRSKRALQERDPGYFLRYFRANKEKSEEKVRQARKANPQKFREYVKNHRIRQGEEGKRRHAENVRNKRRTCPFTNIASRLRCRLGDALRNAGARKAGSTLGLVGCTLPKLMAHLQSKFTPGMDWGNRGLWHVDHIKPCSDFDLSDPEQQKACFHYTNLQPLWAIHNLQKSGPKRRRGGVLVSPQKQ